MDKTNPTLRTAHKLLKKIVKKIGDPDLHFSAQLGVDSSKNSTDQVWAGWIDSPKQGIAPVTFASYNKEEFIQSLKDFLKDKISKDELEIMYHEVQIESNTRSSKYHEEEIEKIKNPDTEEPEGEATTQQEEEARPQPDEKPGE